MSDPTSGELHPVGAADHVLGAVEPELMLIEYGDFGCPFCFAANRPVRSLLDRYPAVGLVWRHLPDSELHPGADLAAELSEFASDGGKFWQAHSLLLAGRDRFSAKDLLSVARQLDLDPAEAEAALRERRYRERVLKDIAGAERAGVHGTPTFFVGAERLEGSWGHLAQLVPSILERR
jgi:protein-disulfide isomerase